MKKHILIFFIPSAFTLDASVKASDNSLKLELKVNDSVSYSLNN